MAGTQRFRWIDVDWEQAKCINFEYPDWFFNYEIERTHRVNRQTTDQREFCSTCPIVIDCLNYALRTDVYGFWGGTTREERKHIRKEQKIQYESLSFEDFSGGRKVALGRRNKASGE